MNLFSRFGSKGAGRAHWAGDADHGKAQGVTEMIRKIALASVLVTSVLTTNVKPAEAQLGVWLGRAAWVGVGVVGYDLWQRYHYGHGGFGYGPSRYWSRGYYGPPRYAYGSYYGPPRGYYGY